MRKTAVTTVSILDTGMQEGIENVKPLVITNHGAVYKVCHVRSGGGPRNLSVTVYDR